ncbi:FAD-dependent oxidoreductase [Achromobacter mucicolens]|uniref:NAD(P)/FAD-dependent oxidoreductase n=1 Tax=Achromobacter mucicolens TaxID=1389922 RepID=UPI002446EDB7|nr:FAD-dependent oxidoreductase [Achromobacter mucicolens]MDH0091041.1 FAD-dependent oxidoreductase [Achromobacter mucicolens]
MSSHDTMLIVGAGQAGAWAARTLREQGHAGRIVLCGAERHVPYERPPLSKGLLTGVSGAAESELLGLAEMQDRAIEFLPSLVATKIDPADRVVLFGDGREIGYDKLLLATGGSPRRPPLPGLDSPRVHTLRTLDDALALRRAFSGAPRTVIIGGGWIGLETAATACSMGCSVSVIEAGPRLCGRSLMSPVSQWLLARHEAAGIRVRLARAVTALDDHADGIHVRLDDGSMIVADLVLVGVGMQPNDALAREAGLDCGQGVRVDAACRTSDPHIYAAGDVAVLAHPRAPEGLRLESWQNAQDQGVAAARAMLGQTVAYLPVPLLWSEQYEHMIQIAGLPNLARRTVWRATPGGGRLYLGLDDSGVAVAAVGIDAGRDFRAARKAIEQNAQPPLADYQSCDASAAAGSATNTEMTV